MDRLSPPFLLPVADHRLETRPLFDESLWFAQPSGRAMAGVEVMTEQELPGRRLLLLTEGHGLRDQVLSRCRTPDRDEDGDCRATSLEIIREMVATGMESTLLPAMADEFRNRGAIVRPLETGVGQRIGLVWRRSYPRLRDLNLLARTLRNHLPDVVSSLSGDEITAR